MALEITGEIKIDGGITLNSAYARTSFNLLNSGDKVFIITDYYVSKEAYDSKNAPLNTEYYFQSLFDYDRAVDGDDLLLFSNEKIKNELEALGLSVTITEL